MIVNESGTYPDDFVGADGSAYPAAANCYASQYGAGGYCTGEWDYYVGIVVRGVQLMSTEINHIMASRPQLIKQLLL
jgi:hypothetical protein